jgi:hypothetical protein
MVSPASLTVVAGASATFTLTLNLGALQTGQHDSEGAVLISDGGATIPGSLDVPYWVRIQFQNGTPPFLSSATARKDATTPNQVDVAFTAHDDDGDIASFLVNFLDATGNFLGIFAQGTFGDSQGTDVAGEIDITGVGPSACPGCAAVALQIFDSKGYASNVVIAHYGSASPEAVPDSTGKDFRRVIPIVAKTISGNSSYQSDVRVLNPSPSHAITLDAYFVPQGQAGTSALHTVHFVMPRESLVLNDIVMNDFATSGAVGSLVLVANDGSEFLASARNYTRSGNGTYGSFVPGEKPDGGIGLADGAATANGFKVSGGHTTVGATEITGVQTVVKIEGFDPNGFSLGSFTITLLPYSNQQYDVITDPTNHFSALPSRVDYTVLSGGRAIAYAISADDGSGDTLYSKARFQPESADDQFVTEAAHTPGSFGSFYTTDLTVSNRSTGPRTFRIDLLPAFLGGTPAPSAAVALAQGQTIVLADVLRSSFSLTGDSGSGLRIHPLSAASLVISGRTSTANRSGSGAFGFFMPPASGSEALLAGGKKVSIQLSFNVEYRANFGFTEISGSPMVIRVTYFNEQGTPLGTKSYLLAASSTFQTSVSELIPAGTSANGYLEFTVDSGSGAAITFANEIDNTTNDPSYAEGEDE